MHYNLAGISRDWRAPNGACVGLVTAAFWVFTYLLLTFWARVLVEEPYPLLSLRRAMAVSAGAFIYWIVLRRIAEGEVRLNPLKILAAIVPAGVAVLAVRVIFDALFFAAPLPPSANIRWVLVWTGYFGLWVSGALAFRMRDSFRAPATRSPIAEIEAGPVAAIVPATFEGDAALVADLADDLDWLASALASELETLPAAARAELAERLMARGGYHLAEADDADTIAHNRRADLVLRVAARLGS